MRLRATARAMAGSVVLGAAVLSAGLAAGPAHADEPATLKVDLSSEIHIGAFGSPGKRVYAWVTGRHVAHARVDFDEQMLRTSATAEFPPWCTTEGTRHTCAVAGGDEIAQAIPIVLHPVEHPHVGIVPAQLTYQVTADHVDVPGGSSIVVLVDGFDLAVTPPDKPIGTAKTGDHVRVPVEWQNVGDHPARGFQVEIVANRGLALEHLDNCAFIDKWPFQRWECTLDAPSDVLAPGQSSGPLGIDATVTADAIGLQSVDYAVHALSDPDYVPPHALGMQRVPSGKGLHLPAVTALERPPRPQPDIDDSDNGATVGWTVPNTFDVSAVGATATGKVGDVVKLEVGLHDNGPAFLDKTQTGDPVGVYEVTLPPGVDPVLVPGNCTPLAGRSGALAYRCVTDQMFVPVHQGSTVIFRVRITNAMPDARGSVAFVEHPADLNSADDTAQVVLNPTATGLPITGAQTALIAGIGALLLVAGGALAGFARLTSRRRRRSADPR